MKTKIHYRLIIPTITALLALSGCESKIVDGGGGGGGDSLSVCPLKGGGFNDAHFCTAIRAHSGGRIPAGIIELRDRWDKKTLKVKFVGGSPALQARVIKMANTWSSVCGIKFDFGNHAVSDIRVAFQCDGHWSHVGRHNAKIAQNKATMNLQLSDHVSEKELRRVVLHEFGHAIGMQHEHQHPEGMIPWNEAKVLAYYKQTQNWDAKETHFQVLDRNSSTNYASSGFDKTSIMMYPIDPYLTDGRFSTASNTTLSSRDVELVSRPDIYGPPTL
jgi:serralysin